MISTSASSLKKALTLSGNKMGEHCEAHLYHYLSLVWFDWNGWHLAFFLLQFVWGHHGWVLPNISVKGHSLGNLLNWTPFIVRIIIHLSPTHQKEIKGWSYGLRNYWWISLSSIFFPYSCEKETYNRNSVDYSKNTFEFPVV